MITFARTFHIRHPHSRLVKRLGALSQMHFLRRGFLWQLRSLALAFTLALTLDVALFEYTANIMQIIINIMLTGFIALGR